MKSPSNGLTAEERRVRIDAVKVMARALCAGQGPEPKCICNGSDRHCYSLALYGDYAISAILALEKAGFIILPPMENT